MVITPNSLPGQTQTILKLQIFAAQPFSPARPGPGPFLALARPCSRPDKICLPGSIRPPEIILKNIASPLRFWLHQALAQANQIAGRCRLTVIYTGRVQGVGFRYAAKTLAAGYEVTGTIRNLPGGGVELLAEGRRDELEAFCAAIREAGLAGFIDNERLQWDSAQNKFCGFDIIN